MKVSTLSGFVVLAMVLTACSMSMSPEQNAQVDREYRPVIDQLIPACIATASGRKADYSAIRALGYNQRNAMVGSGDYLYPSDKSVLSQEGVRFIPGEGCHAQHDGVSGVAMGGMQDIGVIWTRALKEAGYQNMAPTSPSDYIFTKDGVKMALRGKWLSEGYMVFSITRAG